jgi:hypothetical protein
MNGPLRPLARHRLASLGGYEPAAIPRLRPLARHRLAGLGGYEPAAIPRLRELIMRSVSGHACRGEWPAKEATA